MIWVLFVVSLQICRESENLLWVWKKLSWVWKKPWKIENVFLNILVSILASLKNSCESEKNCREPENNSRMSVICFSVFISVFSVFSVFLELLRGFPFFWGDSQNSELHFKKKLFDFDQNLRKLEAFLWL